MAIEIVRLLRPLITTDSNGTGYVDISADAEYVLATLTRPQSGPNEALIGVSADLVSPRRAKIRLWRNNNDPEKTVTTAANTDAVITILFLRFTPQPTSTVYDDGTAVVRSRPIAQGAIVTGSEHYQAPSTWPEENSAPTTTVDDGGVVHPQHMIVAFMDADSLAISHGGHRFYRYSTADRKREEEKRKVQAEALRDAAAAYGGYRGQLRTDVWLNVRADRIDRGHDD